MIPFLLRRDSHASRSIAFNLSALEAGDELFGDERYREAFWIFRLVFPYEEVQRRSEAHLEYLKLLADYEKRYLTDPRRLMRIMEWIGDTEFELKALGEIENYDQDLFYRIARGYMEAMRYREACEGFLHLHGVAGKERAEESLYLAFVCASRVEPPDRCYAIARRYMDTYPGGTYYDDLTLLTGQMYSREKRWTEVIRHFSEVLQVRPQHQMAAECLFLLGYAHFMEEQYEQATVRFRELRERFPGWEQLDAAIYWTAMSLMFATDFEAAEKDFTLLLQSAGASDYAEDGAYRRAVCNYALGQYDLADERLAAFLQRYPEGKLRFEAHLVRADVAGAVGRLDDAVAFYQAALAAPDELMNIEFYNHCAFQAGQILYDSEKFEEVRTHFADYIRRNREGSNVPLAVYWTGKALFNLGEQVGAVRYYRDAVATYGTDRKAMGVDLILDECGDHAAPLSNDSPTPGGDGAAWKRCRCRANDPWGGCATSGCCSTAGSPPASTTTFLGLLQPENLEACSPAVMETMLDARGRAGRPTWRCGWPRRSSPTTPRPTSPSTRGCSWRGSPSTRRAAPRLKRPRRCSTPRWRTSTSSAPSSPPAARRPRRCCCSARSTATGARSTRRRAVSRRCSGSRCVARPGPRRSTGWGSAPKRARNGSRRPPTTSGSTSCTAATGRGRPKPTCGAPNAWSVPTRTSRRAKHWPRCWRGDLQPYPEYAEAEALRDKLEGRGA